MRPTSLLITNDLAAYGQAEVAKMEMIISVTNDGRFFHVAKNRYGFTSDGGPGLPISILPQVIEKPDGMLVFDWK
jgi:hypothetical protein